MAANPPPFFSRYRPTATQAPASGHCTDDRPAMLAAGVAALAGSEIAVARHRPPASVTAVG
jgi:hypothetical protein